MTPERWEQIKSVVADALERTTQERSAFLAKTCREDTDLRREVESMLAHATDDTRFEDAVADLSQTYVTPDHSRVGQRVGAYRIAREIGRGGMGAVYLGERADAHFQKQVALKILKRGTDTEEVLRRFQTERQILAGLEHPNIAHLVDGGMTEDGLPFFAMQYVQGTPITTYCSAGDLSVSARIELFLKVCGAVQFAHQNLVVHRDLKPANILITAEGEPKLLDFGIAKLIAPEGGALAVTLPEQQRLTPAYASPEQVQGAPITTVSDVYSLGAVLYELLVGFSPHRFGQPFPSATELWRVVGEVEAARPSAAALEKQARRPLRGDLDNILLTALRKEPARRYSGVGAFAEDLRRYLGNRPVRARRATLAYRSAKFVRRNKVTTVAVILATGALLAGTVLALSSARRERAERQRAERHFADVRRLANSFLFEFHDKIAGLPGATEARRLVVSRALEYLDKLNREAQKNPALQMELAEAYLKIGDVQGKPYTANLGESAEAIRSYRRAAEIAASIASDDASRIASDAYANMAAVQVRLGQRKEATANNERALALAESALAREGPHANAFRRVIISAYLGLGDAIQADNHQRRDPLLAQAALAHYRQAQPLAERLLADHPDSVPEMRIAWRTYGRIARMLLGAKGVDGQAEEVLALNQKTLELSARALQLEPQDSTIRRAYSIALVGMAFSRMTLGRDLEAATDDCARALEMQEALRTADPSNLEAQQDLAYTRFIHGRICGLLGNHTQAAEEYHQALKILEPLVATNPGNNETRFDLEEVHRALAAVVN